MSNFKAYVRIHTGLLKHWYVLLLIQLRIIHLTVTSILKERDGHLYVQELNVERISSPEMPIVRYVFNGCITVHGVKGYLRCDKDCAQMVESGLSMICRCDVCAANVAIKKIRMESAYNVEPWLKHKVNCTQLQ